MPRTPRPSTLTLSLPPVVAPLRQRIADAIVGELRTGRLRPGDALPATRTLARDLRVSRGAVVAAYDELAAAGFVDSRAGSGTVVAAGADLAAASGAASHVPPVRSTEPAKRRPPARAAVVDLRPGRPDPTLIDAVAWRRAWRQAAAATPSAPDDVIAHERLRRQLAVLLRRTRGITVQPNDILVVPGVASLVHVLPDALDLGARRFALEDPGYAEAWAAVQAAGCPTAAVPVDSDGLDPAHLSDDVGAVYVTPAHQYPLGARMPVARRVALLEWARRHGGIIIEDDYDGEFRYDVAPLPALRSMSGAADRVLYLGTASKLLTPRLRLAWVVGPPDLLANVRRACRRRSLVVNEITGEAVATFLETGAWAAHHARAARTYAARRQAVVRALAHHLPELPLAGIDAGLQVVLRLPADVDDTVLVEAAATRGITVAPLSDYCVNRPLRGLVLGYARLPESAADEVIATLAGVIRGH